MPAQPPNRQSSKRFHPQAWRDPLGHLVLLDRVDAEPVRWLSPGRLAAGKLTVLDGETPPSGGGGLGGEQGPPPVEGGLGGAGLGKSTLLCELAARVTRGQSLPDGPTADPRAVVMLSAEDDLHDAIRPRSDAAGGDPTHVISLLAIPDGPTADRPLAIPGDVPVLETIVQHSGAALLIVDPLLAYLHRRHNANSDRDVRRALLALKTLGERTGAAIVVVRHLNTSSGINPLYRGGGTIGIIGAARRGLLLAQDPDDPARRILAATKGNLGRPPAALAFHLEPVPRLGVARVVWDGPSPWTAADLLQATAETDESRSALAEARAWPRDALANGPLPAREIQQEAAVHGIGPRTLKAGAQRERHHRPQRAGGRRTLVALPPARVIRIGKGGVRPASRPLGPLSPLSPLCHRQATSPAGRMSACRLIESPLQRTRPPITAAAGPHPPCKLCMERSPRLTPRDPTPVTQTGASRQAASPPDSVAV